jgi:hypothetical protein
VRGLPSAGFLRHVQLRGPAQGKWGVRADKILIFLQMHATCKKIMSLRFSGFCGQKSASGLMPHEKQQILDRPTAWDASGVRYI